MKSNNSLIIFLLLSLHSQFLSSYISVFYFFNIYFVGIAFLIFSSFKMRKDVLKFLFLMTLIFIYFIYRYDLNYDDFFSISIKSLQFNFGYLILIPCLLSNKINFDLKKFVKICFYFFSFEIIIEYIIILFFNPEIFSHVPESYLYFNNQTYLIELNRAFGVSGNSSVSGVQLTVLFLLNISLKGVRNFKSVIKSRDFIIFIISFLLVFSGSAFFSIIISLIIYYFNKIKLFAKLVSVLVILVVISYLYLNIDFSLTSNNKFSISYLFFLLFDTDNYTSLIPQFYSMIENYGLSSIVFGNFIIPWGQEFEGVFMTVDYTYLNLLFEFGLIGLFAYFCIFYFIYKKCIVYFKINSNYPTVYIKMTFLILLISTFHYPVISYYYTQAFLSIVFMSLYNSTKFKN